MNAGCSPSGRRRIRGTLTHEKDSTSNWESFRGAGHQRLGLVCNDRIYSLGINAAFSPGRGELLLFGDCS